MRVVLVRQTQPTARTDLRNRIDGAADLGIDGAQDAEEAEVVDGGEARRGVGGCRVSVHAGVGPRGQPRGVEP